MFHLDHALKKLITHSYAVQKILILLYWCIICENNVAIILWHHRIKYSKTTTIKSFEDKTKKKTGITPANNNTLDTKVVVSLKYLSNF